MLYSEKLSAFLCTAPTVAAQKQRPEISQDQNIQDFFTGKLNVTKIFHMKPRWGLITRIRNHLQLHINLQHCSVLPTAAFFIFIAPTRPSYFIPSPYRPKLMFAYLKFFTCRHKKTKEAKRIPKNPKGYEINSWQSFAEASSSSFVSSCKLKYNCEGCRAAGNIRVAPEDPCGRFRRSTDLL